jgi:integral membrane sensor domain MASE1
VAPNALLFAALLLAPTRWWWLLLLRAAGPPAGRAPGQDPDPDGAGWFVSNVSEALIGALIVRRFSSAAVALRTVRSVLVFCVAAVTAALLSSFLDAGLVRLIGWGNADFGPCGSRASSPTPSPRSSSSPWS